MTFEGEGDQDTATFASAALEECYQKVGDFMGFRPEDRVSIILYPEVAFTTFERPTWAGGVYDGKVRIPTQGVMSHQSDFRSKLAHEYAHAIFHHLTQTAWSPAWLNEGLAQVAEGKLESKAAVVCRNGHRTALHDIEKSFGSMGAGEARRAYPTSQHAVERLIERHGEPAIRQLLQNLQARMPFPKAFELAMGESYESFQVDFDAEGVHP